MSRGSLENTEHAFKDMQSSSLQLAQKTGFFVLYVALILFYCVLYAPFGLENNDGGFILGLAYQFSMGAQIYEDIAYIRPPLSIILHSINFMPPFEASPILSSRVIYFAQLGVYSAVTAFLFSKYLKFTPAALFILAAACFMFNAHNFPPMAWHTVDGLFFSVLAMLFAETSQAGKTFTIFVKSFFAFAFALLAALSKQPFYIVPFLVALITLYPFSVRQLITTSLAAISSAAILYAALVSVLDINSMVVAISSQTTFRDLIDSGVINYASDWYGRRTLVFVGPLAAVLLAWEYEKAKATSFFASVFLKLALVLSTAIYLAGMLYMFLTTDHWVSPTAMLDSIFTITGLVSIVETLRTRERIWLLLAAFHGISWAASISWGYTTIALFSAPSVVVIAIVGGDILKDGNLKITLSALASFAVAGIFFVGNQFLYSLEGPVKRSDVTVSLGADFPTLTGVMVTQNQAESLRELKMLRARLGENVVVLPNWPLYNTIFGGVNPIGVDWLLNAELGPFEQIVRTRLDKVKFALVYRNASPRPSTQGRFGSEITQSVMQAWNLEEYGTKYFQVYSNPHIQSDITPD